MEDHLSDDLITEILCLLPIKILVGCKCVCKKWNSLISDVCIPKIAKLPAPVSGFLIHTGNICSPEKGFTEYVSCSDWGTIVTDGTTDEAFVESYSSLLPPEYSPYNVLDCCNGLILLGSRNFPQYYVCNPATKQCIAIPKDCRHDEVYPAALAFDPRKSLHYKIIRFIYEVSNAPSLDIFSSETGEWIRHKVPIEPPVAYGAPWATQCVYSEGMLYSLCLSKRLLCFDLKAMTAEAIKVPYENEIDTYGFIGVSNGILYYANHDPTDMLIWQFDNHNRSGCFWILKRSLRISILKDFHPAADDFHIYRKSSVFMPYAIHPTYEMIILGVPYALFTFHLETYIFRKFCCRPTGRDIIWGQCTFYPYTRCYVSLTEFTKPLSRSPNLKSLLKGTRDIKLETRTEDEEHIEVKRVTESA